MQTENSEVDGVENRKARQKKSGSIITGESDDNTFRAVADCEGPFGILPNRESTVIVRPWLITWP